MKKYRVNTAQNASSKVRFADLFRFATRLDRCFLVAGVFLSALQGALSSCSSVIFRHLTDALAIGQLEWDLHQLDFYEFSQLALRAVYTYVGFGILVFFIGFSSMCCWHSLAERQAHAFRCHFLEATLRQDAAWFDANETGTLTNRMNDGVERIRDGIGDKLGAMVAYSASFVTGMSIAITFSWKLTAVMAAFTPLFFGPLAISFKLMSSLIPMEQKAFGKAAAVLEEVLNGIRTVIAFNGQEREVKRYESELQVAAGYGIKKGMLTAFGAAFLHFCLFNVMAVAFWFGTHLVVSGELSPGTLFAVFWAVISGAFSLGQAAPQLAIVSTAIGAVGPILEVIDRKPPIDAQTNAGKRLTKMRGDILFQNVFFRYPSRPSIPVLKGVTINVKGGSHVAFVGHSGSGKSTLVQLLTRGYLEQGGRITIDGVPIAEMNVADLRNHLGVVSQEPCLFDDTVENNIRLGKEDLSLDEIYNVCRTANAHDFIAALPNGYMTMIGSGGVQLSGGQRQRLAIARVLAKNPAVLILDEATSALDAESEATVQKALENAKSGRTTISIAHRLSTIRHADCIYVFDGGMIVENGSKEGILKKMMISGAHEDLLAKGGVYTRLVEAQEIEKAEYREEEEVTEVRKISEQKAENLRRMSRRLSRGIASTPSVDSSLEKLAEEAKDEPLPGLLEVLRFARPQWSQLTFATFCSILRGLCFPVFSVLYGRTFKILTVGSDEAKLHEAFVNSLFFMVLSIGVGIVTMFSGSVFSRVGEILTMRMRVALFGNIVNQDGEYLDKEEHSPGRLAARVSADAPNIRAAMDQRLADVIQAMAAMVGGIGVAFYYGPKMAPVGILTAGGLMLLQGIVAQYLKAKGQKDAVKAEEPSRIAMEAIGNHKTVQLLNRQEFFVRRFVDGMNGPHRRALLRGVVQSLSYAMSISFLFFNFAAAYRFGIFLIHQKVNSPFTVFQVIESLNTAAISVLAFATFMPELIRARLAAALLFRMLAEKPNIDSSCKGGKQINLSGEIRLQRVFFAYPNTRESMTLAGFHLSIPKGSTVALVGPSGCGKSTLFQLLFRFYDPIAGQLIFDGEDQRQVNLRSLRSQMAIVGQEPVLFNYSIRENIGYGFEGATQEQIEEAARLANAHEFITKMPLGYSTIVGERGSRLSGGQKQRIAIARAVVGNPKILLLDEATSALDADSEKIVQEALEKARKGRTCIVIAHRLSSIQNADFIAYINAGRVEEIGNHQSLLAQRGKYAALVEKQQLG